MKLINLYETPFDEQACWDYLYRECLFEMHRNLFNSFVRSKVGQAAKYKGLEFVKKQGEEFKSEFLTDNPFLEKISFSNGVVNTSWSLAFYHYDDLGGPPPFKFGTIDGDFLIESAKSLTEIQLWFPEKCRQLYLNQTGITSLHNINKIVKECQHILLNKNPIKYSIIGLMLINNLRKVDFIATDEMVNEHPIDGAYNSLDAIIQKNLAKRPRDIFAFQEDLLSAGWKEYAKL